MTYDSLEAYVADREYQAYMQGLNQEPKYTPLPNGYKICPVCEISTCREDYKMCYTCLNKIDPEKNPLKNFRASIDHEEVSLSQDGGGGERLDTSPDSEKRFPAPADTGFNEECINDKA